MMKNDCILPGRGVSIVRIFDGPISIIAIHILVGLGLYKLASIRVLVSSSFQCSTMVVPL